MKDATTTSYSVYILFETIGYILKNSQAVEAYEEKLLPKLNEILQGDRTDIMVYVFQIYAAFVTSSKTENLHDTYTTLARSILESPDNTAPDMKYLVPGQLKLLCAILYKTPEFFGDYVPNLFGLITKVITELRLEGDGLELLSTVLEVVPLDNIGTEVLEITKTVFSQMVQYKQKTKSGLIPDTFIKSVLIYCSRVILTHGSDKFMQLMNGVKNGMILNFLDKHGHVIGKVTKANYYRRHVLAGF